jgi:hypothetical protein
MKKILILPIILASILSFSACEMSEEQKLQDTKITVYSFAEQFAEERLKSPGTAEFPGIMEKIAHVHQIEGNKFKVKSWVDSQNGFGGTVRTKFQCIISLNDEGDRANLDWFKFVD